jgi:hypothetical protein
LVLAVIAIALIDVYGGPRKPTRPVLNGLPLYGTGVAPDVAAVLGKRGEARISAPTPEEFAGEPKDPARQYSMGMPNPSSKR